MLTICKYGNPILRKKSKPVTKLTPEIHQLIKNMYVTLKSVNGLGLAANQVGEDVKIALIDLSGKESELKTPLILINPRVIRKRGRTVDQEGCLSFPSILLILPRAERVEVEYCDKKMQKQRIKADGLLARALQHEIDHLEGKTFIRYLPLWKQIQVRRLIRKKIKEGSW